MLEVQWSSSSTGAVLPSDTSTGYSVLWSSNDNVAYYRSSRLVQVAIVAPGGPYDSVTLRWRQLRHSGSRYDGWMLDSVAVSGLARDCFSECTPVVCLPPVNYTGALPCLCVLCLCLWCGLGLCLAPGVVAAGLGQGRTREGGVAAVG